MLTLAEFERYASPGSPFEWDRYNFAHVRVHVDKLEGAIQRLLDEKGSLPRVEGRTQAAEALDGYCNDAYRSLKNLRDGSVEESRLDAADSMGRLIEALFLMHGRLRPYNKYLRWELERFPLPSLPVGSVDELLETLMDVLSTGGAPSQTRLFRGMEPIARELGFAATIDAWKGDALLLLRHGPG